MTIDRVHPDHVRIALERAEGKPFEDFANAFYSCIVGTKFVPLGGYKDGGADARDGQIFGDATDPGRFYQASIEEDPEAKIRRTISRLKEFGRTPKNLVYLTSNTVRYTDRVERDLTRELDVTIAIRDGGYITLHINDDAGTKAAYQDHLQHYTDHLRYIGTSNLIGSSTHVKTPAVYVFLANEVQRRSGDNTLVNSVVDALALWALEGTDPDKNILRTPDEVLTRITDELPSVQELVGQRIEARLRKMSKRNYPGGRAVNWHRTEGGFCLPYEVRTRIEEENTEDEALRLRVLEQLESRIRDNGPQSGVGDVRTHQAAETALRALQLAFERQGLEFSVYIAGNEGKEFPTITEALRQALMEQQHHGKTGELIGDAAFAALRGVLYNSTEDERRYLQTLSRTYALLFTLNTEPRLLQFFQDMSSDFRLYVGADQIVRALSEHLIPEPDRMTRNTLLIAARAGAKLILTEPVLNEVVNHLRTADNEYSHHIHKIEHVLSYDIARAAPQIMLRAYLYAKLNGDLGRRQPMNWSSFVEQFCTYSTLQKSDACEDLRQYLQSSFGFQYESTSDLEKLVNSDELHLLTEKLVAIKNNIELARNDALLALAVYGKRRQRGETSRVTEFGWGTWWLTGETRIVRLTDDIVEKNGARYIMRPEFLLNFLGMAPSAEKARKAFAAVFPSMLGIQLARRMPSQAFNKIIDKAAEAEGLDDARRTVEIAKLTNKLKSDLSSQYLLTPDDVAAVDLAAQQQATTR